MATLRSGTAPWSINTGYKYVTKKAKATHGVDWSLSSGWRQPYRYDWAGGRIPKYKEKEITLYNGKKVKVPDTDYDDFIAWQGPMQSDQVDEKLTEYISNASWTQEFKGRGHITNVAFAPRRQLLKVDFDNGHGGVATVVYIRVPKEVYSELKVLADSNVTFVDKDGVQRHVLGKQFWDIVRIRGNIHGSRYNFKYETKSEPTGKREDVDEVHERKEFAVLDNEDDAAKKKREKKMKEYIDMYDEFASGDLLTAKQKQEYAKLAPTDFLGKKQFLKKAGVL